MSLHESERTLGQAVMRIATDQTEYSAYDTERRNHLANLNAYLTTQAIRDGNMEAYRFLTLAFYQIYQRQPIDDIVQDLSLEANIPLSTVVGVDPPFFIQELFSFQETTDSLDCFPDQIISKEEKKARLLIQAPSLSLFFNHGYKEYIDNAWWYKMDHALPLIHYKSGHVYTSVERSDAERYASHVYRWVRMHDRTLFQPSEKGGFKVLHEELMLNFFTELLNHKDNNHILEVQVDETMTESAYLRSIS